MCTNTHTHTQHARVVALPHTFTHPPHTRLRQVMLSETPDALIEQLSGGAAVADPATSAAVADGRRRRGGAGGSGSSTGRGGRGGGDGGGSGNGNGRAAGGGGGEGEDEEEEEDEEARQRRELVQQAASWQVRLAARAGLACVS